MVLRQALMVLPRWGAAVLRPYKLRPPFTNQFRALLFLAASPPGMTVAFGFTVVEVFARFSVSSS
jgi:hypothetical protein